jgi:hypothetical protein
VKITHFAKIKRSYCLIVALAARFTRRRAKFALHEAASRCNLALNLSLLGAHL